MRYQITAHGDDVDIKVTGTAGRAEQLLASLQQCQQGLCACPTDQYDRLADMDVRTDDHAVTVRLTPRTGEYLDVDELRACLDYTLTQADDH
jgi:hypothetical protein